jgi:hypothetical protein
VQDQRRAGVRIAGDGKADAQIGDDGTVPEEGVEAAETGGESKGGGSSKTGTKRFKRSDTQGTLDMHVVKRTKK